MRRLRRQVLDRSGLPIRRFTALLRSSAGRPGHDGHVLIAPPGAGNIGDQAMVEAFVAAADRPVTIVTRHDDDLVLPADLAGRARIVALPHLLYGDDHGHRGDVRALGALLGGAATVSIIGADIMDGVYSLRPSVRRSTIAAVAAERGFDTSIIGFSWNGAAPAPARAALGRAGTAGARLLLRDPASAARVRALGIPGVVETADIVFTDDRRADRAPVVLAGLEPPYALVNASGLIARTVDQAREYRPVLAELRARGIRVVLLPHVLRSTADDLAACRAVHDALRHDGEGEGVTLVETTLAPSEIRRLAASASVVVTGRMHLAVMSLAQGVPAVTLASQGKVEGLMRLFDWPELCVSPRTGMGHDIRDVVVSALDAPDATDRVRRGADRARALARANTVRIGAGGREDAERADRFWGERNGKHSTS
ncbi:polysaccharide pyruvyl transferase family protein [Microbacterium sp. NPDC090007]|uniref:polysaccharide pyruvyl transferase family protein n=1 Tax=Microbacterium sp. NPDC090007 TaxID=3364204 RepID=UPI0038251D00